MLKHRFSKHKYQAKKTKVDGISFPSLLEANYFKKLKQQQTQGDLLFFLRQPKFDLPGAVTYSADFIEFWSDGTVIITDCKGVETKEFVRNKKQVEAIYPIEINIVKKINP